MNEERWPQSTYVLITVISLNILGENDNKDITHTY